MESELDVTRLAELRNRLGTPPTEIVSTLVRELDVAVAEIERAAAAGDLPATVLAAHAASNSALMVGAQPMLRALSALEASGREGDGEAARAAHELVRERWPGLRRRLEEICHQQR